MSDSHQTGKDALFAYVGVDLAKEGGRIGKAISAGGKAIGVVGAVVGFVGGYYNYQSGNEVRGLFDMGMSVIGGVAPFIFASTNPVGWTLIGISAGYAIVATIHDIQQKHINNEKY